MTAPSPVAPKPSEPPPGSARADRWTALIRTHVPTFRQWAGLYRMAPIRAVMRCYGIAAVILLAAALVYNLRAEVRWQAYRADALARGVQLLPAADVPKALPPQENFAAEDGIFHFQASWPPRSRLSHVAHPVLTHRLAPDLAVGTRPDVAAVWAHLALLNLAPSDDPSQLARAYLKVFEEHIGSDWAEVLVAEAKPKTQYPLVRTIPYNQSSLPSYQIYAAADHHLKRAVVLLHSDREGAATALKEIRGGLRIAEAVGSQPRADWIYAKTEIVLRMIRGIWVGLDRQAWSEAELRELDRALADITLEADFHRALEVDRQWGNQVVEEWMAIPFTQRAKGIVLTKLKTYANVTEHLDGSLRETQIALNQDVDDLHRVVDAHGTWNFAVPVRLLTKGSGLDRLRFHYSRKLMLWSLPTQPLAVCSARLRQARLALALERYRLSHTNALPANLETLVPDFLPAVPSDPYDGKPMRCQSRPDGTFSLWSVGPNLVDDRGVGSVSDWWKQIAFDIVWHGLSPEGLGDRK